MQDKAKAGLAQRMALRQVERSMGKEQGEQAMQQHGEAVKNYLNDNGHIICICEDVRLHNLLRSTLCQSLGLPQTVLSLAQDADNLVRLVRNKCVDNAAPLLLCDLNVNGHDMSYVVRLLKNGFPELRIALLSAETNEGRIAMLQEAGAGQCFPRPTESQELLERIASCIYTYGKIDRMLDWARTLLDQGEHLSALQVCKKALDAKGNSTAVLLTIGDVFRAMGQMEKACEAYENASRGSSTNLEPLRRLADIYKDLNNPRKRLAYLERLDQLAPFSVERKLAIGSIYVALNNMEQARKSFNQGMELAGREAMAQVGEVAFRVADAVAENDAEMAIAYWRKGLDAKGGMLNPDDMQALNRLGMSLRREGRWQEACEEYRKALKTMPDNGTLYYNMAMAFVDGKDFESARTAVLKALSLSPSLPRKSAGAAYNMAVIFAELKDNVHALPLLRVALELDPANTQAQALLDKLSADGAPAAPEGEAEA